MRHIKIIVRLNNQSMDYVAYAIDLWKCQEKNTSYYTKKSL